MNFKKSISKKSLLRRISGIALTLVMVINLMYGYSAAKAQVTEEARKASQVAAQKAEANKVTGQFIQVRKILHLIRLTVV